MKSFRSIQSCHGEFQQLFSEADAARFSSASSFEAGLLVHDLDRSREVTVVDRSARSEGFSYGSDRVIDVEFSVADLPQAVPVVRRD